MFPSGEQSFHGYIIYLKKATIYSGFKRKNTSATEHQAKELIMNTRLATAFSRRTLLAAVAMLSTSAALLSAQPAAAAQGSVDPYTQGAVAKADPYTDGAAKFDVYTQGAAAKADPYTQGGDRQADTYGYLSWNGDTSYPNDASRA
ncbi:twin-arginine translocation pathway signal; protein [Ralstonia solanacearum Po82]|uniref:Twin-arginine translocation pathway signal protein n=2 Tax=Ralstonia solanacearum TaxID=305 RepID=F6G5L4_RALS8|nr:twin-arginine translocation pathway signal; protein [Ralstonia solanacearum Po82]